MWSTRALDPGGRRRARHAPPLPPRAPLRGYTLYRGQRDQPVRRSPARRRSGWTARATPSWWTSSIPTGRWRSASTTRTRLRRPPGPGARGAHGRPPGGRAILVPATFDQVDWYPEAFVENLRPRWVLLGHWENFFVPPDEAHPLDHAHRPRALPGPPRPGVRRRELAARPRHGVPFPGPVGCGSPSLLQ